MKKKLLFGLIASIISMSLAACDFSSFFGKSETEETKSETSSNPTTSEESGGQTGEGYYRSTGSKYTYHDLGKRSAGAAHYGPTSGTTKTLVIPVTVKGYESNATEENRERIRKAFFGTSEETGWESVSSYFYKCSYGQMNITGEVTPWFEVNAKPNEIYARKYEEFGDLGTYYVLAKAYEWAKGQGIGIDFSEYDVDEDGWIDSIWLIYSCPNSVYDPGDGSNPFWAFTFWDYKYSDSRPTHRDPRPNTYAWASYDFMDDAKDFPHRISIDAHTYIHEFGHVLGLEDYYDYDDRHAPLGYVDMQDANIGDHTAFSKLAWGWVKPYVVTDSCEITINPATTTGDCILLKNPNYGWQHSPFDEYLLFELITQDGLWKKDSQYAYTNGFQAFTTPGVRIIHVDGRLLIYDNQGEPTGSITSIIGGNYYRHAYSNTPSESRGYNNLHTNPVTKHVAYNDLLSIVNANKDYQLTYSTGRYAVANNGSLFKTGSTFSLSEYAGFFYEGKMHDGTTIPFDVEFVSVSAERATIRFTKK